MKNNAKNQAQKIFKLRCNQESRNEQPEVPLTFLCYLSNSKLDRLHFIVLGLVLLQKDTGGCLKLNFQLPSLKKLDKTVVHTFSSMFFNLKLNQRAQGLALPVPRRPATELI